MWLQTKGNKMSVYKNIFNVCVTLHFDPTRRSKNIFCLKIFAYIVVSRVNTLLRGTHFNDTTFIKGPSPDASCSRNRSLNEFWSENWFRRWLDQCQKSPFLTTALLCHTRSAISDARGYSIVCVFQFLYLMLLL